VPVEFFQAWIIEDAVAAPKAKEAKSRRGLARACLRFSAGMTIAVVAVTFMLVLPLRWIDPPITAFILRERLTSDQRVYHHWVHWEDIASTLAISAVAAEDQKFPHHSGFDWAAIQQALAENRQPRRTRGGSTISQQLAKNLSSGPPRTGSVKGRKPGSRCGSNCCG
jgi:monofunctional biosynthetic peptidoglycan transglycosylase